jgi:amino acid permease
MASSTGLLTWVGILITYLRFDAGVKAQNINRDQFPYKSYVVSNLLICSSWCVGVADRSLIPRM